MKWIAVEDKLLVVYYELTDEQLEVVKNKSNYLDDKAFVNEIILSKGDNAHIFSITANEDIDWSQEWDKRKHLYKTLSWWNRTEDKFYLKEGLCHQQR